MNNLKNFNLPNYEQHPFHLVELSPWPIITSAILLYMVVAIISWFQGVVSVYNFIVFFFCICCSVSNWFSDIIIEATFEGHHTFNVQRGIRLGMCLFIASEVMFFFSFFWAFFHCSLSPPVVCGFWPPNNMMSLDPWGLPLWNTVILLSSGVTITASHKAILVGESEVVTNTLLTTVLYGILFTSVQVYEYSVAPFSINDGIFGSLFYVLTGFHGVHVLLGTVFLLVCLVSHINSHINRQQHIGFECASFYWHFVDVIWLFLFIVVYIWGGNW